ncbi:olfactomedin-like [Hemicordylus capensis]|uniref:olfactomedin-like n=1 Tax=Hemicordylus capensis TaxID=884348 RepID=UPI002304189C|nr:olfactomedin-like [Hemicordylus capensis]
MTEATALIPVRMKALLLQLFFLVPSVIVDGGHVQKVLGVRDGSGQCICSMELAHVVFPVKKVEELETNFLNLTNFLQDQLNRIYNFQTFISTTAVNITNLEKRLNYSRTFGTHVDLDFDKLISDIHTVVSLATNISKNATTDSSKEMISKLIQEINAINTVVTKMEKYDRNNIITAQREISILRKKLQECEDAIMSEITPSAAPPPGKPPTVGKCDHDGLLRVSGPVLVKLNWRGSDFKAGSWGKDFAMGTKFPNHYWVFPMNKDERTLQNFRIYSSFKKLSLYAPVREYNLSTSFQEKCENCGQGGGVVFFNGTFFYNCFDSRSLCKTDPFTMQVTREELEDQDPASFNDWFSYKDVKYQDMDLAGDEKGLWMIHGSTLANGNVVIKKVDPNTMQIGTPWITTQPKNKMTNSFMICGVLYATKKVNSTHEEIYYIYNTNTGRERNIKILMEKPLPHVQSLNYNPNDQKLYMFNDGYLVYYNVTFRGKAPGRAGEAVAVQQQHDSEGKGGQDMASEHVWASPSEDNPSSASDQQENLADGEGSNANQEGGPLTVTLVKRDTRREGSHLVASE